jgi:hypothetical protein
MRADLATVLTCDESGLGACASGAAGANGRDVCRHNAHRRPSPVKHAEVGGGAAAELVGADGAAHPELVLGAQEIDSDDIEESSARIAATDTTGPLERGKLLERPARGTHR